jgi:hypothetical protein
VTSNDIFTVLDCPLVTIFNFLLCSRSRFLFIALVQSLSFLPKHLSLLVFFIKQRTFSDGKISFNDS